MKRFALILTALVLLTPFLQKQSAVTGKDQNMDSTVQQTVVSVHFGTLRRSDLFPCGIVNVDDLAHKRKSLADDRQQFLFFGFHQSGGIRLNNKPEQRLCV